MVQVVLQQGQVEVEAKDFIADYEVALLIHRSVIEDLNSTIRVIRKLHTFIILLSFNKHFWFKKKQNLLHVLIDQFINLKRAFKYVCVQYAPIYTLHIH